jgi:hypothetical protein
MVQCAKGQANGFTAPIGAKSAPPAGAARQTGSGCRHPRPASAPKAAGQGGPQGRLPSEFESKAGQAQPTTKAMLLAMNPASQPMPSSSVRCTCASKAAPAPSARMMAYSRSRAWRLAPTAASKHHQARGQGEGKQVLHSPDDLVHDALDLRQGAAHVHTGDVGELVDQALSKPGRAFGERKAAM